MQRKLNEEFLKEYVEQFSEKVTSTVFDEREQITGKEIISVTSSKQVNFFILKILFGKWQEEMKKLESPYFNYNSTEVRRAMVDFMNTLSQHITIDGDNFIELVEGAVKETILLLLAPGDYLKDELGDKGDSELNDKLTKPVLKYLKIRKDQFEKLLDDYQGKPVSDLLKGSTAFFKENEDDDLVRDEINKLSEVIPVSTSEFIIESFSPEEEDDEEESDQVSEEGETSSIEPQEEPATEETEEEPHSDVEEESQPAAEETEPEVENIDEEEVDSTSGDSSASDQEEDPDDDNEEEAEKEDAPLNKQYEEPKGTLNDKYSSEQNTMVDQLQHQKVSSIMDAISVNLQYMFTKELFDDDKEAFVAAIEEVEAQETFDDAVELLVEKHAKEQEWDMNSDEVKELLKIVFRKFR